MEDLSNYKMDRGKKPGKFLGMLNNTMYMNLSEIIRAHALPFLPAKSLFRFLSVCKDWKLQISTPFFAHNQSICCGSTLGFFRQVSGEPPSLVSDEPKACGVPDPSLKFLPEPVDILSASNGLICCHSRTGNKAYYICNPVTQQWKKLPEPNANHGLQPSTVLVFEPSRLNFEADYKLVCAFPSADFDDATEFEIYSSKEGSWKVSGEICFTSYSVPKKSGVHVNGVVYWKSRGLLAYDLTKDRSQMLQDYQFGNGVLGAMNGKLCSAYPNGQSITVQVLDNAHSNTMQMGSHARMWAEKQRVVLDVEVVGGPVSDLAVVAASGNKLLVQLARKLYLYDLLTKETKALGIASPDRDTRYIPYVNSLVSL
ncbi:F-box protein At5g49610-like [Olea europaea var. sylvestris]|uniref:F-box At5g49610-like n=1 Tax=Olea europaea subsp. europaea TaxID=158383 RepID=A0A8S0PV25_OLEEU|nr:F-box protein At5g49610-like [Olea europaea var. sylvestris]XP_022879836.1 F-box protein At5g49610-like [Olea europaea var. sylvestris]CAA2958787.1 F-box At5g49610-like [Olea europaea subsp. europaea]